VADPHASLEWTLAQKFLEMLELPFRAADGHVTVMKHGNTSRIVSPVLEFLQALQDDWGCLTRADIANDATHNLKKTPDS
jgi:hypothetical protein